MKTRAHFFFYVNRINKTIFTGCDHQHAEFTSLHISPVSLHLKKPACLEGYWLIQSGPNSQLVE